MKKIFIVFISQVGSSEGYILHKMFFTNKKEAQKYANFINKENLKIYNDDERPFVEVKELEICSFSNIKEYEKCCNEF